MSKTTKNSQDAFSTQFEHWFVRFSEKNATNEQADQVVQDHTGFAFMIVWNLFESRCFSRGIDPTLIEVFTKNVSVQSSLSKLKKPWAHFHNRYTNARKGDDRITRLFFNPKRKNSEKSIDEKTFRELLSQKGQTLSNAEKSKLMLLIVQRFRNNIFHGNKKPYTWPKNRRQIQHCIKILMVWLEAYVPE